MSASKSSLMKKKKLELVDIIVRKDNDEQDYIKRLENMKKDVDGMSARINADKLSITKLKSEIESYQAEIDKLVSDVTLSKSVIVKYKLATILCATIAIVASLLFFI